MGLLSTLAVARPVVSQAANGGAHFSCARRYPISPWICDRRYLCYGTIKLPTIPPTSLQPREFYWLSGWSMTRCSSSCHHRLCQGSGSRCPLKDELNHG